MMEISWKFSVAFLQMILEIWKGLMASFLTIFSIEQNKEAKGGHTQYWFDKDFSYAYLLSILLIVFHICLKQ